MKPMETLEALLKRYYQNQRRSIQPDEAFDRKVLEQALAKQAQRNQSSGKHVRRRLAQAAVAAAAILIAAFVILERKAPKAELSPQKETAGKTVSSAASNLGLPTLFQVNLVLREKGLEEACKRMTCSPKSDETGASLRALGAWRMDSVNNGS